MKQTYHYPQTLRNYQTYQQSSNRQRNSNRVSTHKSQHSNHKNNLTVATHHNKRPSRVVHEEQHQMDEYCMLSNSPPSKKITFGNDKGNIHISGKTSKNNKAKGKCKGKQAPNSNSKPKNKQSLLSIALKRQLHPKPHKPPAQPIQVGTHNYIHCQSLQKLQFISNDRSQEIISLINQKAQLQAQNEQLKVKLMNPTFRQLQYVQKIAQRDHQIAELKQLVHKYESKANGLQSQYKQQINQSKRRHREEIRRVKEQIEDRYQQRLKSMEQTTKSKYKEYKDNQLNSNYQIASTTHKPYAQQSNQRKQEQVYRRISPPHYSSTHNQQQTSYNKPKKTNYIENSYSYGNVNNNNNNNDNNSSSSFKTVSYNRSGTQSLENNQRKIQTINQENKYRKLSPETKSVHSYESKGENNQGEYRTYIGEDGFERRVYDKKSPTNKQKQSTTITVHSPHKPEQQSRQLLNSNTNTNNYSSYSNTNHTTARIYSNDNYNNFRESAVSKDSSDQVRYVPITNEKIHSNLQRVPTNNNSNSHYNNYNSVQNKGQNQNATKYTTTTTLGGSYQSPTSSLYKYGSDGYYKSQGQTNQLPNNNEEGSSSSKAYSNSLTFQCLNQKFN